MYKLNDFRYQITHPRRVSLQLPIPGYRIITCRHHWLISPHHSFNLNLMGDIDENVGLVENVRQTSLNSQQSEPRITTTNTNQSTGNHHKFHNPKSHIIFGIVLVVLGVITINLDPLLPLISGYPYSIFPAGILMLASGIASILAVKRNKHMLFTASLTLDILASINLFFGFFSSILISFSRFVPYHIWEMGLFYKIYCTLILPPVIFDCVLKCTEIYCCRKKLYMDDPASQQLVVTVQ